MARPGETRLRRRAFVLVVDACGVGALPDAAAYGDEGTNTLAHVAEAVGGLDVPALAGLGLGRVTRVAGVPPATEPAVHGRLHPLGPGKDSIAGHWELMGVVLDRALPTYPAGLPDDVLGRLTDAIGHDAIGNRAHNGISAIEELGEEHLRTGALILYTSQDSVLQLAAHVERVPPQELYRACAAARAAMAGEHAVGRVIARPFEGQPGAFSRTPGRHDYALAPPSRSYLEELEQAGVEVHAVGKIDDLFSGVGISRAWPGASNADALDTTAELMASVERGLVFANLIETDQVYGHRKDVEGFARALETLDRWLGRTLARLLEDDLLVVTADHGVDPAHPLTDHTREHAPLLAVTGGMLGQRPRGGFRHDGPLADVGATLLRRLAERDAPRLPGRPFLS